MLPANDSGNSQEPDSPRRRQPRRPEPPELHDIGTVVATAIRDGFQQEQAATPAPQQQHLLPPNTPTEATLHWRALILLPDTNIPVPYDGEVQGHLNIIEAVFAFMNKPDQHDAKFVLPSELIGQN